jgi:hypothetical protein
LAGSSAGTLGETVLEVSVATEPSGLVTLEVVSVVQLAPVHVVLLFAFVDVTPEADEADDSAVVEVCVASQGTMIVVPLKVPEHLPAGGAPAVADALDPVTGSPEQVPVSAANGP